MTNFTIHSIGHGMSRMGCDLTKGKMHTAQRPSSKCMCTLGRTCRYCCHLEAYIWEEGIYGHSITKGLAHSGQGLVLHSHFNLLFVHLPVLQRWWHPNLYFRLLQAKFWCNVGSYHTLAPFQVPFWAPTVSTGEHGQGAMECFSGRVNTSASVRSLGI